MAAPSKGGGELSEGVGGTFSKLVLFNTASPQELLQCTHSKAPNLKEDLIERCSGGGATDSEGVETY